MSAQYTDTDRHRICEEPQKSRLRTDFERDRARVLHSAALRRLGVKTQVLGPDTQGDIRTRLSHSLEVAQVGRTLAKLLGADPDIVDTACLAHDLGHPPFGHNGERALNEVAQSVGGFEGNAQTLRILTRLEPKILTPAGAPAGLNLTRATLDACTKYPWPRQAEGKGARKFGVYADDMEVFTWLRETAPAQRRCIEAQIMDLSDDIAYSVHDFEDGIHTGRIPPQCLRDPAQREAIYAITAQWYGFGAGQDELDQAADRLLDLPLWMEDFDSSYRAQAQLKELTSHLIGRFCEAVHFATRAEYGSGPLPRYTADLVIPASVSAEITLLKGIATYYVMAPREVEPLYLQQRTVLFDLVDAIETRRGLDLEPAFRHAYVHADPDQRLRVIIDQVASLTDFSAHRWHASICGMFSSLE